MRSAKIKMTKQTASFAGLPCLSVTFFIFHFSLFILPSLRRLPTGKLGGQKNATKSRATGGVSNPHFQLARPGVGHAKTGSWNREPVLKHGPSTACGGKRP